MKPSELLADPNRWSQKYAARDINNNHVHILSEAAVKFCLQAALFKCFTPFEDKRSAAYKKIMAVIANRFPGGMPMSQFNDLPTTTHEDVISVLVEAGL